ncbi:prolyl oligopeptidase family serine peptidase [Microbulbifer halophilus]|uniref:Prolyl oligopeptidase family serine peptidase n=1 Tax=Microbulbifer halophilus TaxID=453963 RepID=A0ABW5EB47_9GAMM|nr:S9 family peptidase [Microbulbifer halophilus]MCW8128050.1 S9 family peptidase [Microbulbifer halophilus]
MYRLLNSIAFMALALPALAAAEISDFQYEDVFNLEYASDPHFDGRGETVFYVRNFMDKMADRKRSNLWRIDTDGDNHRPLTSGNYSDHSPRLSPDGEVLAFISDRSGKPQIHLLWLDNGRFLQISHLPESPSNIQWSRDGSKLAFTMFVPESKPLPVKLPEKPEGAKWAESPRFIDRATYRADGRGYLKQGHNQVFVISHEGGTPRQLTAGEFDHNSRLAWSKDDDALYFSANRHPDHELEMMNSEIYKVSLVDGEIEQVTERFGPDSSPRVSPDGERLAYLGFEDRKLGYHNAGLRILDLESGQTRAVDTAKDRSVGDFAWADNKRIAYSYDDSGSTKIALKRIGGGEKVLASDAGGLSLGRPYPGADFALSGRGEIAYTRTLGQQPAELALSRNGNVRQITELNGDLMPLRNMAQIEEIRYESSHDGREIQGWVAYPPGFDPQQKYPLLLEIHGGPFANYGPRFAAEIQLYAAAGYVVLYTNPRGSTSYGQEFANLIHHNYPSQDYDDLMSGVDTLVDQGYIDEDRLYVTGGSGGGTLTAWIVGKTDRFRAAVVAKPVINWESFVLTADYSRFFVDYWFAGMPWEEPENYRRRSPLTYAGNITTPTMLLTGEQDYRTPISETEQFYQALKLRQIDTAMVRIPGASHGIAARPSQLIAKVASVLYWFDQYKPAEEGAQVAMDGESPDT